MSTLWITEGLPHAEGPRGLLITVDLDEATPAHAVLAQVRNYSYDDEEYSYICATDGWIQCRLDGSTLTADILTYPKYIEDAGVDPALFTESVAHDPLSRRILRVTGEVDPAQYAEVADDGIAVVFTKDVATREELQQRMADDSDWWTFIFAPHPAPDEDGPAEN
jgi:hypothetical protein